MKNNIALEITKGGHTTGVVIDMVKAATMYTVLSALLHGFDVQIVDIAPRYSAQVDPRTTLDSIFNMIEDAFGVHISFQVFPLEGGPKFNTDFGSYETAKDMATLWGSQFKTPYGISSKVE
jgi:hypothetical protein